MRSGSTAPGVRCSTMNTHAPLNLPHVSVRLRWFMGIAWVAILIKCVIVTWAVEHWHMPFHASWVVVPTLAFAALASVVWLLHRE
jgi:hypothetical protein